MKCLPSALLFFLAAIIVLNVSVAYSGTTSENSLTSPPATSEAALNSPPPGTDEVKIIDYPRIVTRHPEGENVSGNTQAAAVFNMELDPSTITANAIVVEELSEESGPVAIVGDVTYFEKDLLFIPKAPFRASSKFAVRVSGDMANFFGKKLEGSREWAFTTRPAVEKIEAIEPWKSYSVLVSENVTGAKVRIYEVIDTREVDIKLSEPVVTPVEERSAMGKVLRTRTKIDFKIEEELTPGTSYTLELTSTPQPENHIRDFTRPLPGREPANPVSPDKNPDQPKEQLQNQLQEQLSPNQPQDTAPVQDPGK
jgi:hypothetical protein